MSMLPGLPSVLQGFTDAHDDLDFLPSQYYKVLPPHARTYTSIPHEIWKIREEIEKLTTKFVSFFRRMYNADPNFDAICILWRLLERHSVKRTQEVDAQL